MGEQLRVMLSDYYHLSNTGTDMSEALPRRRGASVVTGYAAVALLGLAACAPSKPKTAPTPMNDPRVGLKAGLFDAGEAISNMKVVAKAVSPPGEAARAAECG